jgi:hypothetical protein
LCTPQLLLAELLGFKMHPPACGLIHVCKYNDTAAADQRLQAHVQSKPLVKPLVIVLSQITINITALHSNEPHSRHSAAPTAASNERDPHHQSCHLCSPKAAAAATINSSS